MATAYLSTDPNAGTEDYLSTDPNAGIEPQTKGLFGLGGKMEPLPVQAEAPAEAPTAVRPSIGMPIAKAIDAVIQPVTGGRAAKLADLLGVSTREATSADQIFPTIPPQETTGKQIAAGIANAPINFANFALSPEGVALGPALGMAPKAIRTLVGTLFTAEETKAAIEAPTLQEGITHALGAAAIGSGTVIDARSGRPISEPTRPATALAEPPVVEPPPTVETKPGKVREPPNVPPEAPPAAPPTDQITATPEALPPQGVAPTETGKSQFIQKEVERFQKDYLDTAARFDEHAAAATDPETKAALQKIADDHRTESERAATPEFIKTFTEPKYKARPVSSPVEAPTEAVSSPQANDFTPAIKTPDGKVITGEQGQDHQAIYDKQADPAALRASEPEHGFVDKSGDFKTREEVSKALGETDPMQSERLTELQKPSETTGVANRVLAEEAKAGKIDEIASGEGMTWQEMVDLGREQLNKGADPLEVARRFERNKRISPTDFAVLRAERERLAVESNKAAQAVRDNPNDPVARTALDEARKTETAWIRDVVQPAKTSTSDIFRGMQGEAPVDATTFEGLRRAVLDTKGREPKPSEQSALEQRASKVQNVMKAESEATKKLGEAIDRQLPKTRVPTVEELRAEMEKMAQELTPCK